MEVICENCNVSFKKYKSRQKRTKHNYCSKECHVIKDKERERIGYCLTCNELIDYSKKFNSRKQCNKCYRKEYRSAGRDKNQIRRSQERCLARGLPLDHGPLKNKPFSGTISKNGYRVICVYGHPNANKKNGKILEHQYIMSQYLQRALLKGENVHHKNGIRHDNRIENLELWNTKQPPGQRVSDKIKFYIEFIEQYPEILEKYGYKLTKE